MAAMEKEFVLGQPNGDTIIDRSAIERELDVVAQLNDEESISDPEDQPYRSKYQAREKLERIRKSVDNFLEEHLRTDSCSGGGGNNNDSVVDAEQVNITLSGSDDDLLSKQNVLETDSYRQRVEVFLRYVDARIGANYIDCEETSSGEEHLKNALEYFQSSCDIFSQAACYTYMYTLNQLGILYASRRQTDKALAILSKSEKAYFTYREMSCIAPLLPMDLLKPESGISLKEIDGTTRWDYFEQEHTQTLYYLAQVYQKSEDGHKAAHYCQITLHRQLITDHYDPLDWALNAATLSQYYLSEGNFSMSRHCLASAMKILESAGSIEVSEDEGSLYQRSLDIKRCWVKYGLGLMESSFDRLMNEESSSPESDEKKNEDMFDLELTLYEKWMTDKYLLTFDQARELFLKVQELINACLQFYGLDTYCSDHIELVQDHSRAFKLLQHFEDDFDRQCKMFKRRADMLEVLAKELNPQFYLLVWRQIVYELAEIYSGMLDCKLQLAEDRRPSTHAIEKINSLCERSIAKYKDYVTSLKGSDGKLPDPLPEGDERPTMVAWFCIGRLYSKIIQADKWKNIENVQQTLHYYKLLVEWCDSHAKDAKLMKEELTVCREIVVLLPAKLDKLIRAAQQT